MSDKQQESGRWSELEIRGIALQAVANHMDRFYAILDGQTATLSKIADSAQAQMLSNYVLHGNPLMGVKGVLPEIQERLTSLEDRKTASEDATTVWRGEAEKRFDKLDEGQEKLKSGQHRMRRFGMMAVRWLVSQAAETSSGEDGEKKTKPVWRKIVPGLMGLAAATQWMRGAWPVLVKKCVAVAHAIGH